jgi:hypothetical protein
VLVNGICSRYLLVPSSSLYGVLATIFVTYRKNNVSAVCIFVGFIWFSVSTAFSFVRMANTSRISTENYLFCTFILRSLFPSVSLLSLTETVLNTILPLSKVLKNVTYFQSDSMITTYTRTRTYNQNPSHVYIKMVVTGWPY